MLFRKLLRTFLKYKAQFISMIIMLVLGIGLFVGFNGEWYSIEQDISSFFSETNLADYHIYNEESPFTIEDVNKIKDIDGVSTATRFIEIDTTEKKDGGLIKLNVSEDFNVSTFTLIDGEAYDKASENGIWVSQKYAANNSYNIGDTITLSYGNATRDLVIKGICLSGEYLINTSDNALMPDYDKVGYAYTTPTFYKELSESLFGIEYYPSINVISSLDSEKFSSEVDKALGSTLQIVAKEDISSYSEAYGESDEGKTMGLVLPVIFLLIAVLTMVTTMNRITSNEKVQIGVMKALGIKNRKIIWHYTSYAFFLSVISSILGLILGYGVCYFIYSPNGSMGTYFEMPKWSVLFPWFVYAGIIAIIAFLTLIGFLSVKKQLKGSAGEALRPYEPKKMKPMLIEKTRLFHKFNFATRYNLRDSSRHKARTAMSIFGVFGCTLLLFATFGMKTTMDSYIDINYKTVMNYETSLSLSNKVANERAKEIASEFNGDYSANVATKVEGTTYVCTIVDYSNDLVRLLKDDKPVEKISDDGAYICERMAEDLSLKVGDTFTFALYGKNDKYETKVVDIIQSNTKGFTINYTEANDLGLTYTIDTVYTNTSNKDITLSDEIVSMSSKDDIIKSFDSFMEIMNMMIYVLLIFASLLAFVVLYNLGTMSYIERYRELATLKVLGFKDKKIRSILISQNTAATVIGIIIGCPVGYATLYLLMKLLASNYELRIFVSWYVYVVSILVTLITSILVSYITSLKVKKINMVEALKAE